MTRNRWILFAVAVALALGNVFHYVYARWGLITVNADNRPLAEVMRTIERQGGTMIRTDLPSDTPVTMHVHLVTLGEAMETLSTVTETRWRLAYLFGADKSAVANLLSSVSSGERPEGWKVSYQPMPPLPGMANVALGDPRKDEWAVKPAAQPNLQEYLEQGAQSVSATFISPEAWNPAINAPPSPGSVAKVAPRLAKLAHGAEQEVFLLIKGTPRPDTADDGAPGPAGGFGGGGGGKNWLRQTNNNAGALGALGNAAALEARVRAEIDKLPAGERGPALAQLEERKQFFLSLRDLPADERRDKMEQFMNRPEVQQQMEQQRNAQEARLTPAQRTQRAQRYVQRRAAAKAGAATK